MNRGYLAAAGSPDSRADGVTRPRYGHRFRRSDQCPADRAGTGLRREPTPTKTAAVSAERSTNSSSNYLATSSWLLELRFVLVRAPLVRVRLVRVRQPRQARPARQARPVRRGHRFDGHDRRHGLGRVPRGRRVPPCHGADRLHGCHWLHGHGRLDRRRGCYRLHGHGRLDRLDSWLGHRDGFGGRAASSRARGTAESTRMAGSNSYGSAAGG